MVQEASEEDKLVSLNADGTDGTIIYPSKNIAVVVCKQLAGLVITVWSDHDKRNAKVLATFDNHGVGGMSYPNGKPWLVVTMDGYKVSDKSGSITDRGRFPRPAGAPPISCSHGPLTVVFQDRQHISLTFSMEGVVTREWQVGEQLLRRESHLDKVVGSARGKLELDIGKIRARQAAVGSVYVPRGPHATVSDHPGTGALKAMLANLPPSSPLHGTVRDLQSNDARLRLVSTLPVPAYGTSRTPPSSAPSPSATQALPPLASTSTSTSQLPPDQTQGLGSATGGRRSLVSSPLLPDFGSPPLSKTQRRLISRGSSQAAAAATRYEGRRAKLEPLSSAAVQAGVMGKDALRDALYCLVLLADWNPVCRKLEPQLQAGNHLLQAGAKEDPAGPCARVKVYRVDASDSIMLQTKYGFRAVPMFLMFFEGNLVAATNNITTGAELKAACIAALEKGRRGDVLPSHYKVGAFGNTQLDYITPDMSLLYTKS
mmetsp:Transcript_570/g.1544  ORF Transcript_570/g.1544 Transcript_570/m.1544 type:complete len:486 (-) Transcript_570:164-1621(-)